MKQKRKHFYLMFAFTMLFSNLVFANGIDNLYFGAEGKGGREPIASGENASLNRRVEFILVEK